VAVSEVLLIGRAQSGDRAALDALLAALQEPLFNHIQLIVGDRDEGLDVLQDVLLVIARKLPLLREPRWFRAWAYRIATRAAVRRHRADKVWRDAIRGEELDALPEDTSGTEEAFDAELVATIRTHVAELPPASSLVVRMHYLDGLSCEEIAEALDLAVGTVKSRLFYGRDVLRRRLAQRV
jgi:RNA polymerase sigma factor (sigma-70 family)